VRANTTLSLCKSPSSPERSTTNGNAISSSRLITTTTTTTTLLEDWCRQYPQHEHHIFPYGHEMHKTKSRIIPRTREMILAEAATKNQETVVPTEIMVPSPNSKKRVKNMTNPSAAPPVPGVSSKAAGTSTSKATDKNNTAGDKDDDSGITLDDLQCCVCMIGDASDENDVLLCDGQGCYRAYHMKCMYPEVSPEDIANEEEDWFCPLCSAIDHFVVKTQIACCGEDWEHRREEEGKDDSSSLQSWGRVADVFPTSEWECETAERYKRGRQSEEIQDLLTMYLGEEFSPTTPAMPVGSDSEDEEDYSLFDEESFNERRQKEKAEEDANRDSNDDDDVSSDGNSSAASLMDMSSVELEIGKDELAALTDEENSDSEEDDDNNEDGSENSSPRKRVSRRLRSKGRSSAHQSEQSSLLDNNGADFSEANILKGKRRRKPIDYRKLNDSLFGQLTAKERAEIDDTADFKLKKKRKASSSSSPQKKQPARKRLKMSQEPKKEDEEEEKDDEEENASDGNGSGSDGDNSSLPNSDEEDSMDNESDSDRNSSDEEEDEDDEEKDAPGNSSTEKKTKNATEKTNTKVSQQKTEKKAPPQPPLKATKNGKKLGAKKK
jgi:hypothetical protein